MIEVVTALIAADPGSNAGAKVLFISNDSKLLDEKYKAFRASGVDCYYDQCETVILVDHKVVIQS